ncbi:MAG: hypothetical protein PVH21_01985 [Myxococcales bacterium]|jgi:hypothetical protein
MTKSKSERMKLAALWSQPNRLVARLILAELLAKRGKGPLEPRVTGYRPIRR